ncbi:PIN domain-containing protein [Caulobacter mirabilis]|uniref:VapC toxin family PIN domain ribonuclease n=1 Tax=Caulobacter mirabilis TaxID=69666 RepID=A0A2D2AW78_9CAUL|nr:type II toxin-antitoxin system VapC family toxin [Caulobacter mirabilis]ATQ42225.1 VapC toxin family PIN domain ribonuclease [Caulobacter mirabilis]
MTGVVLDSSALLALILDEPGAEVVQAVLAESVICTVNLSEVIAYAARNGVAEDDIHRLLAPMPLERAPFDEDLAYAAGLLAPMTRLAGLSFGDRACLALAAKLARPTLTADRAWTSVAGAAGVEVRLIR